jgi:hypothetical protein
MKRILAGSAALLAIVAGSISAQAAPIANPIIIGAPTIAVTFANTPPGFFIFNEYLIEPSATITATGGGVGQVDIFAPLGIAQPIPGPNLSGFGGIQVPFTLGLDGRGSVELAMSGKVRTTVTTTALPEEPPSPESFIDIGPDTQIISAGAGPIRFVLDWDLAVALTQEGREPETRRTARRIECPNSVGIVCEQAYDISVLDNSFMPRPGVPSVIETTMNYVVTLESRPLAIPEPAGWPLMTMAAVVIGWIAFAGRGGNIAQLLPSQANSNAVAARAVRSAASTPISSTE